MFDEVFVTDLGETTSFVGVEENIVAEYTYVANTGDTRKRRYKLYIKFYFVVLKGDEWKSKTRVSAEPELKRYI